MPDRLPDSRLKFDSQATADVNGISSDSFIIGGKAWQGVGSGNVYLNGKLLGSMRDGKYEFDETVLGPGDVITVESRADYSKPALNC